MQGNQPNLAVLSAKQQKAIAALLSEVTISGAAAKVGVNDATLHRWLNDATFNEAYRQARRDAVGQAVARLQHLSNAAVVVLAQLMADKATPASVRMHAARTILEFAIRAVELEDLQARVEALEAVMGGKR